jgi:hypothetical protein
MWWLSDVIKHAATASDDSTQLLCYAAFVSSVPLATSTSTMLSPLHLAPSSSPGGAPYPTFLSGLLIPLSVGGKYVTDATLNLNPDNK